MKRLLIAGGCAILMASNALADGPGPVTKIKSIAAQNPSCLMFQTNKGATWYGFSVNDPAFEQSQTTINVSRLFAFPIDFNIGPPSVDCPMTNTVFGLSY